MKSLLELIERAGSNHPENLCAALEAQSPPLRSCALYAFKSGKWEFVQELK
jgi:hypothetical protein